MFTHSARFASVSLSGASPDVKANSINLVDKVVQRSISAQGTLSEGVDLYIPIFLADRAATGGSVCRGRSPGTDDGRPRKEV